MLEGRTTLLPVLVRIQAELAGDLSLRRMAELAGFSEFHFHRRFRDEFGETLKQYTQRLRLEHAAYSLLLETTSVLEVALDNGFRSHETFTRAFRRHFGVLPSEYRRRRGAIRPRAAAAPAELDQEGAAYQLSPTRVRDLEACDLAFVRHLGSYADVPDALFAVLETWAAGRGWAADPLWMGIGHDAPGITPVERLRFDAALRVPRRFQAEGAVGHQRLAGGPHAITTHVGSFASLPSAYVEIFRRVAALDGWRPVGLPAIEIYRTTRVTKQLALQHTDVCLPVERVTDRAR